MKYFLLILAILFPTGPVYAREGTSKPVDPVLYSVIKQQAFLDQAITASVAANLTPEALYELVSRAQASTAVESIGTIVRKKDDYEAKTGIVGASVGEVQTGAYMLKAVSVDTVEMQLPSKEVRIEEGKENIITIVLKTSGNLGSVTYRPIHWLNWLKSFFVKKEVKPTSKNAGSVPVIVRVINDQNGNGELDKNEKLVPWANVIIQLIKK